MKIRQINESDFADYGRYYKLKNENNFLGEECDICLTEFCPMPRPLYLGYAVVTGGEEIEIDQMERHLSTEEIIICAEGSLVMPVALGDPDENPLKDRIELFRLEPGDVAVVNAGVWHAVCRPLEGRTVYYPMTHSNGDPEEYMMHPVIPEALKINITD